METLCMSEPRVTSEINECLKGLGFFFLMRESVVAFYQTSSYFTEVEWCTTFVRQN